MNICEKWQKWHFLPFSTELHQILKSVLETFGTWLERLLKAESPHFAKKYFSKNFLNFLCLFGTKTVLFKLVKIKNQTIPFWFQKGTKNYKNFIKSIFSETMAFKLSNDAPTMPKTFLEHILSIFEVWSTCAKNAILAIFGENSPSYLGS